MKAADVSARMAEVHAAGALLRERPADETLEALGRALEVWRDGSSSWRRGLEAELPGATGFSPPVVREGLALALEGWTAEALRALVADELDGEPAHRAVGFGCTSLLLAGSIPMPTLLAMLAPLVLRSPVVAKPASRDRATPRWWRRSLEEVDADLARATAVVDFPSGDDACVEALLRADCVVVTGSDETVRAVSKRVRAPRRCIGHGHRLSVAALGGAATRGAALEEAAAGLALDVALWDQLGCLSPIAVYVEDASTGSVERVGDALAAALTAAEARLPRGEIGRAAAALVAAERASAELRAADGVRVLAGDRLAWTVVCEDSPAPRPAPLHRFVRVHPVADAAALLDALRPIAPHLAGVAVGGFPSALEERLEALGASRVCRPGRLQAPPLAWRRDGLGVLRPLARDWDPGA